MFFLGSRLGPEFGGGFNLLDGHLVQFWTSWARVVTPKWSWYLQTWPCFQRHWSNAWGDFSLVVSFWSHDHRVDYLAMLLAYMSYFVCKESGNSSFFRFSLAKTVQSRPILPCFIRLVEGNILSGHPNHFDGIKPANLRWRCPQFIHELTTLPYISSWLLIAKAC